MFSLSSFIKKFTTKASRVPKRHDPSARPSAPILLLSCPDRYRDMSVHWWDAKTASIVGLYSPSPNPCDDEAPFGFSVTTGESYLVDHCGDISWPTIIDGEEVDDLTFHDVSSIYSQLSASSSTGTVIIHPSPESSVAPTIIIHSPTESSLGSSIESEEEEDSPITPPCYGLHSNVPILDLDLASESDERDETVPFGEGNPPRRAATITRTVGDAIRKRRSGEVTEKFDADTIDRLMRGRDYMLPHLLTCIEEKDEGRS